MVFGCISDKIELSDISRNPVKWGKIEAAVAIWTKNVLVRDITLKIEAKYIAEINITVQLFLSVVTDF